VPEHYPLETLALLFTVGVQATWASTSPQALRAALTADKKQAALAMHTEDSPTARLLRFYQWCHHMLSRTRLPAFAVLSGLVYLHRLCKSPSHSNSSGLPVDPGSDYRVASIAAILANKYLGELLREGNSAVRQRGLIRNAKTFQTITDSQTRHGQR
jgi:hypothetical protein